MHSAVGGYVVGSGYGYLVSAVGVGGWWWPGHDAHGWMQGGRAVAAGSHSDAAVLLR